MSTFPNMVNAWRRHENATHVTTLWLILAEPLNLTEIYIHCSYRAVLETRKVIESIATLKIQIPELQILDIFLSSWIQFFKSSFFQTNKSIKA